MAKYILIGDIHLNDKGPSSCCEGYSDDLFDLLYQILELAKKMKDLEAIIPLGDVFDLKSPRLTSHKLVQKFIKWCKDSPVRVIGVTGNHDLLHDRLASLWEGQPLGTVFQSGHLEYHEGWVPGLPIYVIHWLQNWHAEEGLQRDSIVAALDAWNKSYDGSFPALLVTHASMFPPGKEPMYEHIKTDWFANLMGNRGAVAFGHIHDDYGQWVSNGVRFSNYGALSRGSFTESNINRQVGVTVWDSVDGSFTFVPLDAKPAEEVFLIKDLEARKEKSLRLDDFLARVGSARVETTDKDSVLRIVRAKRLGKKIEDKVEELLE